MSLPGSATSRRWFCLSSSLVGLASCETPDSSLIIFPHSSYSCHTVVNLARCRRLTQLSQDRGEWTVIIAHRELRKWLRESKEGKAVEKAVEEFLAGM